MSRPFMMRVRSLGLPAAASMLALLALGTSACSKSDTAQARGADKAAKPVTVAHVEKNSVRRSIDVVERRSGGGRACRPLHVPIERE